MLSARESTGRTRATMYDIGAPMATTIAIAIARFAASHRRLIRKSTTTVARAIANIGTVLPTCEGIHARTSPGSDSVLTIRSCHHASIPRGLFGSRATTIRTIANATVAEMPTTSATVRRASGSAATGGDSGSTGVASEAIPHLLIVVEPCVGITRARQRNLTTRRELRTGRTAPLPSVGD